MSVNYGLSAVNSSGAVITSPATLSMLYAGVVTCSITSGTQVFDFPNVPAGALYGLQNASGSLRGGGTHTWVISDGGGFARLTFTYAKQAAQTAQSTSISLFATNTYEPNYGINALNDYGERTISTIYPASKFIGKLTMSPTLHSYNTSITDVYTYTFWSSTTAPDSGLLFWSLPSSTDTTIWWAGDTSVASGDTAKIVAKLPSGTAPSVLPEAFIFKPGPMTVSTAWGVRVFDGAGQVMFDGATESLKIESRVTNVAYKTPTAYTLPSGYTPALYMPAYMQDSRGTYNSKTGGYVRRSYSGMMRRDGTTLYTDVILNVNDPDGWVGTTPVPYYWGLSTGLFVPVINAQRYGGAAI